jgi:RNA polymerase sigma-70 factor (ECF subfamily)
MADVATAAASRPARAEPVAAAHPSVRLRGLFDAYYDVIWRSLRRLGVPAAAVDDAAQEVFMVAARRIEDIEVGRERAFLFGTAVRVASDERRSRARRRESVVEEAIDLAADPLPSLEELADQKHAREMLDRVLEAMPIDLRAVFVLFEMEGMTMAEIAPSLDLAPGTVASRLRRAREWFERTVQRIERRGGRS